MKTTLLGGPFDGKEAEGDLLPHTMLLGKENHVYALVRDPDLPRLAYWYAGSCPHEVLQKAIEGLVGGLSR